MQRTNQRTGYFCSTLLFLTTAAFVSLIFVYLHYKDIPDTEKTKISKVIPVQSEKLTEAKCTPVCSSKECVSHANSLLNYMEPSVDPCDNAFLFSCGKYKEKYAEDEKGNIVVDTRQIMLKILKNIIENIQADSESASGKMKTMYDSCMDYGSREFHAIPTAQKFLTNLGITNWPNLASDFKFTDTNIPTLLGNLKASGQLGFLMYTIPFDGKSYRTDKTNITVRVDARYFDIFSELPNKEAIFHILNYFNLDPEAIEGIWGDYNIIRSSVLKLKDENCREIVLNCSRFDIEDWVNIITESDSNCTSLNLDCSEHVNDEWRHICETVEVFVNASDLIDKIKKEYIEIDIGDQHFTKHIIPLLSTFSDRSVANFLAINFFMSHLEDFNLYFRLTKHRYYPKERCKQWWPPMKLDQWRLCVEWVAKNMLVSMQYEVLQHYLTQSVAEEFYDFFDEYVSEVRDIVTDQEWLPEEVKDSLLSQLKYSMNSLSILKEHYYNQAFHKRMVDDYYKLFQPTTRNFFHNVLQFRKSITEIQRLANYAIDSLHRFRFDVQAYAKVDNTIDIDFGFFVPPFYLLDHQRIIRYASMTNVVGHELGHIISDYLLDVNTTKQNLKDRAKCLENQFSNFKFDILEENLNGSQYFDENIADFVYGMMLDRVLEKNVSAQDEVLLPGLPYSTKQFLYISINQYWCAKHDETEEVHFYNESSHAPSQYRCIGTMQNSRGYAEAFNCPEGSYMNPTQKCSVFD